MRDITTHPPAVVVLPVPGVSTKDFLDLSVATGVESVVLLLLAASVLLLARVLLLLAARVLLLAASGGVRGRLLLLLLAGCGGSWGARLNMQFFY